MSIIIAADHAGFALKAEIIDHLQARQHTCLDLGTDSLAPVDYPDFAHHLCTSLDDAMGILICGTGIGMSIAANRHRNVRCAVAITDRKSTRLNSSHRLTSRMPSSA